MSALDGMEIVFSGRFVCTRENLEREAKLNGAWVEKKVSSKTWYLVAGESPSTAQVMRARQYGVQVIPYAAFMALLRGQQGKTGTVISIPCDWIATLRAAKSGVGF